MPRNSPEYAELHVTPGCPKRVRTAASGSFVDGT
jgi:hypothetical protein